MKVHSLSLALLLLIPGTVQSQAGTREKPDIVVFLTDDQSQLDLTPYGDREIRTPHMQRLADAGMTFTDAYVASPTCAPSRAALLTGLMPARNGAEPNHAKPRPEIRKWPSYFQELGYEVVAFGKVSHYKHTADYGFDYFAHDTFHDHAGIAEAAEFLKNRSGKSANPLCLFVGSNWPHVPWPESHPGYDPAGLPLPAGSVDTPATRAWRARYAAAVLPALALLPIALGGNKPDQEIEHPMAVVILGGLVTSTLLSLFVLPVLYLRLATRRPLEPAPAPIATNA